MFCDTYIECVNDVFTRDATHLLSYKYKHTQTYTYTHTIMRGTLCIFVILPVIYDLIIRCTMYSINFFNHFNKMFIFRRNRNLLIIKLATVPGIQPALPVYDVLLYLYSMRE